MTPPWTASDTAVVCRPEQLAEAAVVLSCFPPRTLPPLFVADPPPCSEEEYAKLYVAYTEMRNLRDEALGTRMARYEALRETRAWSNEEIDRRSQTLTPFRLWVKRRRQIARLLREIPVHRALLLFETSETDLSVIEPLPMNRLSDAREPLFADDVEKVSLAGLGLDGPLAAKAWELLRPGDLAPPDAIETSPDPTQLLTRLYEARQTAKPLRIRPVPHPAPIAVIQTPDAREAVLIETVGGANSLAAVNYALRQNATLCVIPEPAREDIESVRQQIQAALEAQDPVSASACLPQLETAVSSGVPTEVIDAIGALPLTAFTAGVPYSFLRKGNADWSSKPIGLLTGDAMFLCSAELFGRPPESRPRFHVLFDPGFFQTNETTGVLSAMHTAPVHPLLLQGVAASNIALISVGAMPVDLLYFNTHGSAESILLSDMPLAAYKLLQRVTLQSRPVVFNNSCLSWTGVGRELVIAGARAYVGTLWSVNAAEAAEIGIEAVQQLLSGKPVANCLQGVGPALTRRAYIVLGPVCSTLPEIDACSDRERTEAAARILLGRWLQLHSSTAYAPALLDLVRAEAETLCRQAEKQWPVKDPDRLNLLTDWLSVLNELPLTPELAVELKDIGIRGLFMADTSPRGSQTRASFFQQCARSARQLGRTQDALNLLAVSAKEMQETHQCAGSQYLLISDMWRDQQNDEEALQAAFFAGEAFDNFSDQQSKRGRMVARGRTGQLLRKLGKVEEAYKECEDGYNMAVLFDDLAEQAKFKMDECRIELVRGHSAEAIGLAEDALKLVRRTRDEDHEVAALGTLTVALSHAKDWIRAEKNAKDGLTLALERNLASQTYDFYRDLTRIAVGKHDLTGAMQYLADSASPLLLLRDKTKIAASIQAARELLQVAGAWRAEKLFLTFVARIMPALEGKQRPALCSYAVKSVMWYVDHFGWPQARDPLWQIKRDLDSEIQSQGDHIPEQVPFLRNMISPFHDKSKGDKDGALLTAKKLDELSLGVFKLAEYLSKPS